MVVMMLTYQPLILRGVEDLKMAKTNAYGALFSFVASFGASIFYLLQDSVLRRSFSRRSRRRSFSDDDADDDDDNNNNGGGRFRRGYSDVPTNSTDFEERNALNMELPRSVSEGVFS